MLALTLLLACSSPSTQRTLTVLAASSLTESFLELEADFEAAHPDVDVVLSFAGSQTLATQLRHGLKAEVYASADAGHAQALQEEALLAEPRAFAGNELVLVTRAGEHEGLDLRSLAELERVVVGGDEVPIGRYTRELFEAAESRYGATWRRRVEAAVVSREPNVRLAVAKVALGEAQAAVAYRSDLEAAEGLRAVELPLGLAPEPRYLHGALAGGQAELAASWMDFVEGQGQLVLQEHGFHELRLSVHVDRKGRQLYLLDPDGELLRQAPVGIGRGGLGDKRSMDDLVTPTGRFLVDLVLHAGGEHNAVLDPAAPGELELEQLFDNMSGLDFDGDGQPDRAYGGVYVGLDGPNTGPKLRQHSSSGTPYWYSIALHATPHRENLGAANSGGCVHVDEALLLELVADGTLRVGVPVVIADGGP